MSQYTICQIDLVNVVARDGEHAVRRVSERRLIVRQREQIIKVLSGTCSECSNQSMVSDVVKSVVSVV